MDKAEKRIVLQKDIVERIEKAYANYKKSPKERITTGYVQGRMDALDTYWKEFKGIHEQIILSMSIEDRHLLPYFAEDMFDKFEELYYTYKGELNTALQRFSSVTGKANTTNEVQVSNTNTSSSEVRLPRISIPTFSGNYTEWQSFHDLFVALIHKHSSLENVQKLHYLKSSLTGDAEVLLRQVSITADNYTEAWAILKKRYNNKRYIANNVFKKFFGQRALSQESSAAIKQLLDTSAECMNALKNLGLPTDEWDAIVVFAVVSKLDVASYKEWEETISEDLPGFERLKKFLETRFRTLEMVEPASKSYKQPQNVKPKTFHATANNDVLQCAFCKDNHYIHNCKQFAKLTIQERYDFVQSNNLCFNCLIPNHTVFKCRQGTTCQICKKKHHSLLHREKKQESEEKQETTATIEEEHTATQKNQEEIFTKVTGHVARGSQPGQTVLLATALVDVTSSSGQSHVFRALIDQGSEASFVTARVVELLGLKKTKISGVVSGVGEGNQMSLKHLVNLQIKSKYDTTFFMNVNAYVLRSLTRRLPAREFRGYVWPQLKEIGLADPTFNVPGRIDILLGADVFGKIIDIGLMRGPGNLVAQHSHLGWILSGDIDVTPSRTCSNVTSLHITRQVEEGNNLLHTTKKAWSKDEETCVERFKNTNIKNTKGIHKVELRLKQNKEETVKLSGETKQPASKKVKQLERKFKNNNKLEEEYGKVMHKYLHLEKMERPSIYLEHHAVIREDKDNTKVRVAYDALSNGFHCIILKISMLVGPTLQPDLSLIIHRRCHKVSVVGDIVEIYRPVRMTSNHTDLQRIVRLDDASKSLDRYQLLRVTFKMAAAPYLAVKTLDADDDDDKYPHGAAVVKDSSDMVDLVTGHEDLPERKKNCYEVNRMLKVGTFNMQTCFSDPEELLKHLRDTSEKKNTVDNLEREKDKVRVFGLTWDKIEHGYKLELCGEAIIAKQILHELFNLLKIPMGKIYLIVVLAGLRSQPVFRRNGVSEIVQLTDNHRWRQVQSRNNPADLASRGNRAKKLVGNDMWWTGQVRLKEKDFEYTRVTLQPTSLDITIRSMQKIYRLER